MVEISGYTMDLYCDHVNHVNNVPLKIHSLDASYYNPKSRSGCVAQAKKDGWKFLPELKVICKRCRDADKKAKRKSKDGE